MVGEFFAQEYYGNTLLHYAMSAALIIISVVCILIVAHILKKKQHPVDAWGGDAGIGNAAANIQKYLASLLIVIIVYSSIRGILTFPERVEHIIYIIFIVAITYYGIRLISTLARTSLTSYLKKREKDKDIREIQQRVRGVSTFNNIVIGVLGIIFLISNLGFNITAVLTGLGIGGVALALASQNIFRDLFNYFVIFFDQPFQIGDFIIIEDKPGTIEKIGIKTTRIRSLGGEELIIANTDLTSNTIHNYKRMNTRRVLFTIGVVYQTSPEHLAAIPEIIRNIIEGTEHSEFDRAHFKEFGDSSLNFEIVYYVLSPDYNVYMDTLHSINLKIFTEFAQRGIEFAYPTRTIYIEK
jgi:small-conductance mechanosensitive channel